MFEPYNPYGQQNPYQQQANPYYQRFAQQPQQGQQQYSVSTNKLYANGMDDVRSRQLPPNSDYIFLDNDQPLIYRKTVDGTGKMDLQVFKIVPYEPEKKQEQTVDLSGYVLKSDFDKLRKDFDDFIAKKE